jgi:hypothetical protein
VGIREDRLVILWNRSPGLGMAEDWFSTAQYFDIRGTGAFADVALAIGGNDNLTGTGQPERIGTIRVSSNLLSDARRPAAARTPVHRGRGSRRRGRHGAAGARDVAAALRR